MPETDEKEKIKKITNLLEKGGTMLATHHECGAPMFRYQGRMLCPVCDSQEEAKEKAKEIKIEKTESSKAGNDHIALLVKNKIHSIAATLENETDLQRVREKMECIELGIKILKLIEG